MNEQSLSALLQQVQTGTLDVSQALDQLRRWPVEVLESARIDHHRPIRTGLPEAIFGENKTVAQLVEILTAMLRTPSVVLATRVAPEKAAAVLAHLPDLTYHPTARILTGNDHHIPTTTATGPWSSSPPALRICRWRKRPVSPCSNSVTRVVTIYDAGVAGIHRILAHSALLQQGRVIIVAAGMEGALPSVVAGLTGAPVIGVPTSIGYGVGAGGYSALLGMLNSCSPGLAVVNIDNGFGAACMAAAINRKS